MGNTKTISLINHSKFNFSRYDTVTSEDVRKKLADKWEKKHGYKGIPTFFSQTDSSTVK